MEKWESLALVSETWESSAGRGDVGELSGGLVEQAGMSGGYGLRDTEDDDTLSCDDEGRLDDDKAQGYFDDRMISLPSQN